MDNFVGSGEFNDIFDVFSNFMQNATSDYTAEAGKIAAISSKLASKTAKHPREEADRTHRSATSRRHRGESHAKVIRSDPLRVHTRQETGARSAMRVAKQLILLRLPDRGHR